MTMTGGHSAGTGAGEGLGEVLGEALYCSERTRVIRLRPPGSGHTVIRKEPRGAQARGRLRHERTILERLAGVEGVPRLVDPPGSVPAGGEAVVVADVGGVPLACALAHGPLDPAELLPIAIGLAGVVVGIHRRGVVHKDITPANVLLAGQPRRPWLIDYDLATTFAEERPGFTHQNQIVGTLAYLAPEQTGRTGRPVDQRADLYGLGATLYEAATGAPPFGVGDPLRLTHDHLARTPVPPATANPAIPTVLSDIILRLLEKEPDRRYQSAEGLVHDLVRLRDALAEGQDRPARFALGERDFPVRLAAPSRLVGRDTEIAALRTAFTEAIEGRRRGVLVSGVPGVGKTTLIDELRPIVNASGGWFISGKFDQYRQDFDADAVQQALTALVRLLLAEPEAQVAQMRARLRTALGPGAALLAGLRPEMALLLGVTPAEGPGDPLTAESRLVQAGLEMVRTIASPSRPLVLVLDDLQWAAPTPVAFLDALLTDRPMRGLLVVGAYRDTEVDAAHPLSAMLRRWLRLGAAVELIRLQNLPPADLGALLAEMLRLGPDRATELARTLAPRTGGNPYDSVELVNSLRRDGALAPGRDGWRWDGPAVRRHVGPADVMRLLTARIDALPRQAGDQLEVVACLGGEVSLELLAAATGQPAARAEALLLPALEDGLLVMDRAPGVARGGDDAAADGGTVRFRHDRVQQAAFGRLSAATRAALHLEIARRLVDAPAYRAAVAEQYLPALNAITDSGERYRAADVLRQTAAGLRVLNPVLAERMLAGALGLVRGDVTPDQSLITALEVERHAALFCLGRLDDADEAYRSIERRCPDPMDRVEAACVQISSLASRNRYDQAMAVGLGVLAELGVPVPAPDGFGAAVGPGMADLARWAHGDAKEQDLRHPEMTDPRSRAAARLVNHMGPAAFQRDPALYAWLVTAAWRLWTERGPCAELAAPLANIGFLAGAARDYRLAQAVGGHVLAVGQARWPETDVAHARFLYACSAAHWFDPLEEAVGHARRAHEALLRGGELHVAAYNHNVLTVLLLDCAPTLSDVLAEAEAGLAFTARIGHVQATQLIVAVRQLVRALWGETDAPDGFGDTSFDESAHLASLERNPPAAAVYHTCRGIAAALCGNTPALVMHAVAAARLEPAAAALYTGAHIRLLLGLALAAQVRAGGAQRGHAALDACHAWLAERAADAPANFAHLARLVEAERAWALGDAWAAAAAFDAAMSETQARRRPWHRAFIAERAAAFHREHGMEHAGRTLLAEARAAYQAWGATAKVRRLDEEHPWLPERATAHGNRVSGGPVDR